MGGTRPDVGKCVLLVSLTSEKTRKNKTKTKLRNNKYREKDVSVQWAKFANWPKLKFLDLNFEAKNTYLQRWLYLHAKKVEWC